MKNLEKLKEIEKKIMCSSKEKNERRKILCSTLFAFHGFYFYFLFLYVFLLFLKIGENNLYLF